MAYKFALVFTGSDNRTKMRLEHDDDDSMRVFVGRDVAAFLTPENRVELLHWLYRHASEDERPRPI